MKNKFILICAIICSMQVMATNLVVESQTGAKQLQDISLIGKWVFEEEELILLDKSGNILAQEAIINIKKITFSSSSTATENVVENSILIYPNPTQDVLHVKGVAETTELRIYDLRGQVLMTTTGAQINVTNLSNGTYLLQIGTQVARFIKQ